MRKQTTDELSGRQSGGTDRVVRIDRLACLSDMLSGHMRSKREVYGDMVLKARLALRVQARESNDRKASVEVMRKLRVKIADTMEVHLSLLVDQLIDCVLTYRVLTYGTAAATVWTTW